MADKRAGPASGSAIFPQAVDMAGRRISGAEARTEKQRERLLRSPLPKMRGRSARERDTRASLLAPPRSENVMPPKLPPPRIHEAKLGELRVRDGIFRNPSQVGTVLFEQRQVGLAPFGIVVVLLIFLGDTLMRLVHQIAQGQDAVLFAAVLLLVTAWAFGGYRVQMTPSYLVFGFRIYRKAVPLERIISAQKEKLTFGTFGIQYNGKSWLFSAGGREAVNLRIRDDGEFIIGTPDAETLLRQIGPWLPH